MVGFPMDTYWLEQTEADLPAHDDWLSSEEADLLSRMRFVKRRADWRLGRWTAKRAAAACLNLPDDPHALQEIEVRPASSGAPELYVSNRLAALTISLSHRTGVAACAIAMGNVALGCDLELIESRGDGFVADYFTAKEQGLISHAPKGDQPVLATLLWSAKESALKALREGLRLDTRSLDVTLPDHGPVAAALRQGSEVKSWRPLQVCYREGEVFQGWWQSAGQLVRTLVGAPSPLPPLFLDCALSARSAGLAAV
jgi:4'-phosphopantetheinyl transferase